MDDLVRWLTAQLDEEQRIAEAATDGPWIAEVSGETGNCVIPADAQSTREYVAKTQLYAAVFDAEHIACHNPSRVLREIDTKRQVLARYEELRAASKEQGLIGDVTEEYQDFLLRLLALPYADREGYRAEWALTD